MPNKSVKSPTWSEIKILRADLLARLPVDTFLKTVLSSCLQVGRAKTVKLRGNFVAAGLREAVSHVLHVLAPDEDVRACVWFVQATDTLTVTRRQRADYIVKAGLPEDFVANTLGLDLKQRARPLLQAIDGLNKSTHVRPETILSGGFAIRRMFHDVLVGLGGLLDAADESRNGMKAAIESVMHEALFDSFISRAIDELDEISTHTRVDGHSIDQISVKKIDAKEIYYEVTGTVDLELQYGSNSDVANDIGFTSDDCYPYTAAVKCKASKPMDIADGMIELHVDNSSFYE